MGRPRKITTENIQKEQEEPEVQVEKRLGLIGANTLKDLVTEMNDLHITKEDFVQIVYNSNAMQYYAVYEYEILKEDE